MYRVHMRTMKYIYLITAIWCGAALTSSAQQIPRDSIYHFTLQDCINYAYQHQDSVVNANLDVKSADYKVKEITGQGLPQINGQANFQDYLKTPVVIFGTQKFSIYQKYTENFGLNLNQLLFDGTYLVGLKASKTYKELSQRNYTRSKIQVNVNVTKAYYQVLVSGEQIRLLDANMKQLKQQVDETIAENKQGLVEKIDVDRITFQYNNLITNRENTVRMLSLNAELLKFQMGMPIKDSVVLKDDLQSVHLDTALSALPNDTGFYHNRIEYNLLETNVRLNELQVKQKKAALLPTLSFTASGADVFQTNTFSQIYNTAYPSSYVGLTLNVPIFSSGIKSNQIKEAKISLLEAQNNLFNLQNALDLQVSKARISYINGIRSLNNQRQNQALAQEVLRVARIKYQQGVGSSIEVTQAETDLVNADNQYIQGLYDALISKVDLDQAYGNIK